MELQTDLRKRQSAQQKQFQPTVDSLIILAVNSYDSEEAFIISRGILDLGRSYDAR